MFGKYYTPDKFDDDGVPRWNFNDFWHAFMMVFRVLCGEWIEPVWDCMRATSPAAAISFFIPALIIGNFVVSYYIIEQNLDNLNRHGGSAKPKPN